MSLDKIEAAKQKSPEERTPEERRLANLNPFPPGVSGNPAGMKKGCKNWSTHFKRLMGDPDFLRTIIAHTPSEWQGIVGDTPADVIAAGLIANVMRGVVRSMNGEGSLTKETKDAIALLNKIGYGDKVVYEDPDSIFTKNEILFKVVPSMRDEVDNATNES